MKPQLNEVTPDIIKGWKEEHGTVFMFKSEDGCATGYFKKPTRKMLEAYSVLSKDKPVMANEMLVKDCFLGGDETLITEDAYFLGLSKQLPKLLAVKEGELTEI